MTHEEEPQRVLADSPQLSQLRALLASMPADELALAPHAVTLEIDRRFIIITTTEPSALVRSIPERQMLRLAQAHATAAISGGAFEISYRDPSDAGRWKIAYIYMEHCDIPCRPLEGDPDSSHIIAQIVQELESVNRPGWFSRESRHTFSGL